MAVMDGFMQVIAELRARAAKANKDMSATVTVGYTAAYAIYTHENMQQKLKGQPRPSGIGTYWSPGQPKFLEQPARELGSNGTLAEMLEKGLQAKLTVAQCLVLMGMRLQRESQALVPVEYSLLKASAFTRLDGV